MRMQNSYFTRFMPTDSTGNTTVNWDEIEKIVGKDASEITAEEYYALSVVYLNLDAEDLTRFLSLFIDKTKDVDMPWYNELFGPAAGQCNEDYSGMRIQRHTICLRKKEMICSSVLLCYRQSGRLESFGQIYMKILLI